ncbi:LPS translocon maturation chaperone LptM [Ancylobacter sp. SL191]|uniref:LPS translocon maturation chaperone LptM n=1 Tax=Ancylobacter sp. SL191 TaxID=2995166 RepID=UPI00226FB473|nr:lipoprotein [Ancylobacter sp. SL191]WAC28609.1 lipoprotein [Ancylobacter sp. SL191]
MSRPRSFLRVAAVAVLMGGALALAGCGVRGPLEPPPDSALGQPGPDGKMPKDTGPVKPNKPFILDPLL